MSKQDDSNFATEVLACMLIYLFLFMLMSARELSRASELESWEVMLCNMELFSFVVGTLYGMKERALDHFGVMLYFCSRKIEQTAISFHWSSKTLLHS